ncbi:hypothetical protein LTR37_001357 [Vermiconidia calcicola]|uniref:Uncharacterized protein n=1 Tax=Vermiconidia calcicola TaxID=1690605 RepID=A0ACC3NX98_9PEZI|nr:hypothetical protein LTR37_001357 [Vermiconidia calcicola]
MSTFTAINTSLQPSASSSRNPGAVSAPCNARSGSNTTAARARSKGPAPDVLHPPFDFEYPVLMVFAKRTHASEVQYLICWDDSKIAKRHIAYRDDGTMYVSISGLECVVEGCEEVWVDGYDEDICKVQWRNTWQPVHMLKNAQDAIAEFETHCRGKARSRTPEKEVRTSIENVTPTEDTRSLHPRSAPLPCLKWKPTPGTDYRLEFRSAIRVTEGERSKALQNFPEENDRRPLLFKRKWIGAGHEVDANRPERKRAIFAQISGVRQSKPCSCCEADQRPFSECVVARGICKEACASCVFMRKAQKCNFHLESQNERWHPELAHPKDKVHASSPRRESSAMATSVGPEARSSVEPEAIQFSTPATEHTPMSPSMSPWIHKRRPSTELGMPYTPPAQRLLTSNDRRDEQSSSPSTSPVSSSAVQSNSPASSPRHSKRSASETSANPSFQADGADSSNGSVPRSLKRQRKAVESCSAHQVPDVKPVIDPYSSELWNDPDFRHAECGNDFTVQCTEKSIGIRRCPRHADPSRCKGRVFSDKRFTKKEATAVQVRYILSQPMPCRFMQFFEDAWRSRKSLDTSVGSKELFLAEFHTAQLGEAVFQYCPRRPSLPEDAVVIDLESELE